jgi:hypothetical protein
MIPKKILKVVLYLVMGSALIVSLIGGRCDAEILAEEQHFADELHRNALEVKGKNFFVTDSQLQCHEIAKWLFLGEITVGFILIFLLNRPDKISPKC